MDFFGGQSATVKGPIIGKVPVKKVLPASTGSGVISSRPGFASTPVGRSGPGSVSASPRSGPSGSSSSSKKHPMASSARPPLLAGKSHLSSASRGSTPSANRKKRTPSPVRSESDSSSDDGHVGTGAGRQNGHLHGNGTKKRKRPDPSPSATPTPGLGTSSSSTPRRAGRQSRELWCLEKIDQRGEWGRGWAGFVSCEEAVRGDVLGWRGGKGEAKGSLEKYRAYFPQDGFGVQEPLPSVEILYPAPGCRERFVLLIPTSPREYNPMSELRNVLRTILDHYIPPSHSHVFGTLSDSLDLDVQPVPSRLQSPNPSALATPPPDSAPSPSPALAPAPALATPRSSETIADAIRKALAPNRRDGPGLVRAIERYNAAMEELQKSGEMGPWLREKSASLGEGEWSRIVDVVHDQAYSRVVGPYSNELEHHPKHPDEVARAISGKEDAYGELRHNFMNKIIAQTHLSPQSTFVDLGSGVGNCVLQTALQAGCRSLGVELLPVPAHCARLQVAEVRRRWAMWGLNGNIEVEVEEGDFRGDAKVARWLAQADVVLVNNEVFPPSLNDDLKNMFLDLKDGAQIISLKPFVNDGFRMNESNCDSFDAIVKLSQHSYYNDWVSWKGDSGKYYVQVIDRSMRKGFEEEMLRGGGRRRR